MQTQSERSALFIWYWINTERFGTIWRNAMKTNTIYYSEEQTDICKTVSFLCLCHFCFAAKIISSIESIIIFDGINATKIKFRIKFKIQDKSRISNQGLFRWLVGWLAGLRCETYLCNLFWMPVFCFFIHCYQISISFLSLFAWILPVIVSPNYDSLFELSFCCFAVLERENSKLLFHRTTSAHTHFAQTSVSLFQFFLGCFLFLFHLLLSHSLYASIRRPVFVCTEHWFIRMDKSIWHNTLHLLFFVIPLFLLLLSNFFFIPEIFISVERCEEKIRRNKRHKR